MNPTENQPYPSHQIDKLAREIRSMDHPTQVGPYHILERVGEGGMGVVYKAEQRSPIQRIVAVKIIKLGMDTRQIVERFEAERQALAMMDHPNVARVIDAGSTADGRPYFVMEYVDGEPITRGADRLKLTIEQRLELFTQACSAVEHAHQKAIIHRDLKPSNILVTQQGGKPWVKVIDFGVAKAIEQRLTEKTVYTDAGQFIGTLEYMSPEQADSRGLDIDTRTDIYSLGVVLYELLTGAVPFDALRLRTSGHQEVQRIIREVDPPRPSTKLSGLGEQATVVAASRQIAIEALEKQLHRELDWIPLKAMRKDRAQRYATATELADDIANYLAGRALRAGPESAAYRARKFLLRNRLAVAASAAIAALLLFGITATTWQAIRATRAERRVRAERREVELANANAQAVNNFLTQDLLGSADPAIARGEDITVRKALDEAAKTVGAKFKDRPLIEASVRQALATTYQAVGRADLGLPQAQASVNLRRRVLGDDHRGTLESLTTVASLFEAKGEYAEAEAAARDSLQRHRRVSGNDDPATLLTIAVLANTLYAQGKYSESEALHQEALKSARRRFGDDDLETQRALGNLATVYVGTGKFAEAEPLLRESSQKYRAKLGSENPDTLHDISNLAFVLGQTDHRDEAESLYKEVLAVRRKILGDEHPDTLETLVNLGFLYSNQSKFAEAEPLLREALQTSRRVRGENHPHTAAAMNNLASVLHKKGELFEAEALFREVLQHCKALFGENHPYSLGTMNNLGNLLFDQGRFADAEPFYAEVYQRTQNIEHDPKWKAIYISGWGPCLVKMQQFAKAEPALREAHKQLTATGELRTKEMAKVLEGLAIVCEQSNQTDEASKWRGELAAVAAATRPASQPSR